MGSLSKSTGVGCHFLLYRMIENSLIQIWIYIYTYIYIDIYLPEGEKRSEHFLKWL